MTTYTLKCQLVAKEYNLFDYKILVFKILEEKCPFGHSYSMVTVFPNWQSNIPDVGDIGYVTYNEVQAGIDTYYDRNTDSIVKYNFSNLIFQKFVKEGDNYNKDIIIL